MPSAIHPLVRELRRTKLADPNIARVAKIFDAAKEAGITPAEARLLGDVFADKTADWDAGVRRSWGGRLSRLRTDLKPLVPAKADAAASEDLASRVEVVLTQGFKNPVQRIYVADMIRLAEKYDFKVVLQVSPRAPVGRILDNLRRRTGLSTNKLNRRLDIVRADWGFSDWSEDNKFVTNADDVSRRVRVMVPPQLDDGPFADAAAFTELEGYHPLDPDSFQGAVADREEEITAEKLARRLGRPWRITHGYIEGGNILPATSSDGKPYALVGRDTLIISAYHLDSQGAFTKSAVSAQMRRMRSAGALSPEAVEQTAETLLNVEQYHSSRAPQKVTPRLRAEAEEFLAKLELTKKLLAKDLGIPASRVVYVTQPDFHIDMHMRPLGPGEVMVNHPRECIKLIDEALRDPKIKSWQRKELGQMRERAEIELEERGPVYDRILGELEAAGLIAITAPGVFQSDMRQANFMNAVPGTSHAGKHFFFTTGSSITSLQAAFGRFVKRLGVDRVEFVANEGGNSNNLSAGEQSLEEYGALDCREVHHGGRSAVKTDAIDTYLNA